MWRNVSKKSQLNDPSRRWFQDLTFFPKRTSLRPGIPPASFLLVLPFPTMSLFLLRLSGLFLLKSWHFWSPAPPITVGLLHRQQTMPSWPHLSVLRAQGCGRLVSVRNTTHLPRCIYFGAWTQWTYRWSAKICTQHGFASRLCADKLSDLRQVWYPFSTSIS